MYIEWTKLFRHFGSAIVIAFKGKLQPRSFGCRHYWKGECYKFEPKVVRGRVKVGSSRFTRWSLPAEVRGFGIADEVPGVELRRQQENVQENEKGGRATLDGQVLVHFKDSVQGMLVLWLPAFVVRWVFHWEGIKDVIDRNKILQRGSWPSSPMGP